MNCKNATASLSRLPDHDGDGYSWGGSIVLTIGHRSIILSKNDHELANEIANRWNAGPVDAQSRSKPDE